MDDSSNTNIDFEGASYDRALPKQGWKQWLTQTTVTLPIVGLAIIAAILGITAIVIILSLIPTYLTEKTVTPNLRDHNGLFIASYKTNLQDVSASTRMSSTNDLSSQLAKSYGLQPHQISVITSGFNAASNVKSFTTENQPKTSSITCDDQSIFEGTPFNIQFGMFPAGQTIFPGQWRAFLNRMEKRIRTDYKKQNMTIRFADNQTKIIELELCTLKLLAIDTILPVSSDASNKINLQCDVAILGAGVGGSYSAYRLASTYKENLCVIERENHVGGRTYDVDYDGNVPPAYSEVPVSGLGGIRFYAGQTVVKALADELKIPYYPYAYQTTLIKSRGQFYTSYNEMCTNSFIDLSCDDDADGYNAQDQLWVRLLDVFQNNGSLLYRFADFNALCRYVLGEEGTSYLKDSFRFRSDFFNVDPYTYMEFTKQDWNLAGTIYYPYNGLSQFSKRMIYQATTMNNARLYLNESVLRIDDNVNPNGEYLFSVESSNYIIKAKQLVIAIPPSGWTNIEGSVGNEIKAQPNFQSILPVKTVVIDNYWPRRWWEESSLFGADIDRAWTRQNCISFIEILSQHPAERDFNLTRSVYDDGLCTDTWSTLIDRPTNTDLIDELLRGLGSLFPDVDIPPPTKTFTHIWPGAWHFRKSNAETTNKQLARWALKPLSRFEKNHISLVGEAYNIDRSGWIDGAIKSSMMSLASQFQVNTSCVEEDAAVEGPYCASDYI